MTIIEQINGLELVKLRFELELCESFHFKPGMILHWRKELVRGARLLSESGRYDSASLKAFLDPSPADDPYAQKRFQKPAPPFVVDPESLHDRIYSAGEILFLDVLFPGDGVQNVTLFTSILFALAPIGLYKGGGRFDPRSLSALTLNEGWQVFWQSGEPLENFSIPYLKARWLIEEKPYSGRPVTIRFLTPARLLHQGRPLFQAEFKEIFPYMMRRVSSVLYSSCRIELKAEISSIMKDAAAVVTTSNRLAWDDWRHLEANNGLQGVGGLGGSLQLTHGVTDDLFTILRLAELFHIGKLASYGAGCFQLITHMTDEGEKR